MKDVGKNIRTLRIAKNMTQEELAQALYVTRQTISNYETGRSRPDVQMLMDIAAALGTDANCVLYGPPLPEDRRAAYRAMLVGGAAFLVLALAAALLHPRTEALRQSFSSFAPDLLVNLIVDPAWYAAAGWCVMQAVGLAFGAKPLARPWAAPARRGILALLAAVFALQCPFFVWLASVSIRAQAAGTYDATFSYVPIYQELLDLIMKVGLRATAVYGIIGALLWTLGFPARRGNKTA